MIDPDDVVKFDRTNFELQEFLMFCVLVAGKSAKTTAKNLEKLFSAIGVDAINPLEKIHNLKRSGYNLPELMRRLGFGCYNLKANALIDLANAVVEKKMDIKSCSLNDLEKVKGIGPKTARFFMLYSRPDIKDIAVLDTHLLKYLQNEANIDVPKATPSGKKYLELEKLLVDIVKKSGKTMHEFDLEIWMKYSKK